VNEQFYMFVRRGLVQRMPVIINGESALVWPVARTHQDALKLSRNFNVPGLRPALIGSIKGETLEGHLNLALYEGCVGMAVVDGWDRNDSPIWGYLPFDQEGDDE
jgi:hypothetical protein